MTYAPNSLAARDIAYAIHPYTDLEAHAERGPVVITRGEGVYVYDDEGNKYLEGLAGLWCVSLGFSEPRLVEAATRQLRTLPYTHIFSHRSSLPVIELAERLVKLAPEPLAKVLFANSGSEAVDTAIKLVWYYNNALGRPEKKKIISRLRAYHGVTVAGGSLTALPMVQQSFDLPIDRFLHTDTPYHYRNALPGESEEDFATRLAESLDALIQREGPETVAAFIAEPVMGAGGAITPPRTYFDKVQEVVRRHDVLMIADEVICGFGRTGNFWGSDTYGIVPDIMTCAKQLSSAYIPISAVLVSDPVFKAIAEKSHEHRTFGTGFTYSGHPVAAAVAIETLKIYEERDTIGHVREVSPRFLERLHGLREHRLVGHTRGVGLIGGIEIVADRASKAQFPPEIRASLQVQWKAHARGLIVRGLPSDCLAVCPPLIITEAEIDELFDKLALALDDAERDLRLAA